jgi:hypothetical protein
MFYLAYSLLNLQHTTPNKYKITDVIGDWLNVIDKKNKVGIWCLIFMFVYLDIRRKYCFLTSERIIFFPDFFGQLHMGSPMGLPSPNISTKFYGY